MKKSMLLVAACLFATCSLFAQNSAAEINAKVYSTEIEKFINECDYKKTEFVEDYKTKSCIIEAIVVTNLKTNKKMGGIHLAARDLGEAILTLGASSGETAYLGYLDVSEINDVLTVLSDILKEANAKQALPYRITYTSNSALEISYDSTLKRLDIQRTYGGTNAYGTPTSVTYSTNDITINEVGKIMKKLQSAKSKIEKACNQ